MPAAASSRISPQSEMLRQCPDRTSLAELADWTAHPLEETASYLTTVNCGFAMQGVPESLLLNSCVLAIVEAPGVTLW